MKDFNRKAMYTMYRKCGVPILSIRKMLPTPTIHRDKSLTARELAVLFCVRVIDVKTRLQSDYTDRSPLDEMIAHQQERKDMHPATYYMLSTLLHLLSKWGEAETCKYIRGLVRRNVPYWEEGESNGTLDNKFPDDNTIKPRLNG